MFAGPAGWHIIVLLFFLAPFVLWIVAVAQIALSHARSGTIATWIVVVTLIPLAGAVLWFAVGKRAVAAAASSAAVAVSATVRVTTPSDVPLTSPPPLPTPLPPAPPPRAAPPTTPPAPPAPPGWYSSPILPGLQQWWDGSRWTGHLEGRPPAD
ncbi:MAG: DUF2510 domain-containing protein [Microbacteriaceae bacterium]|nr:MAG: DUF2510 domain-containing protein [Microbacteriaceae bacterium]